MGEASERQEGKGSTLGRKKPPPRVAAHFPKIRRKGLVRYAHVAEPQVHFFRNSLFPSESSPQMPGAGLKSPPAQVCANQVDYGAESTTTYSR